VFGLMLTSTTIGVGGVAVGTGVMPKPAISWVGWVVGALVGAAVGITAIWVTLMLETVGSGVGGGTVGLGATASSLLLPMRPRALRPM
jgi:hypothetical protein